MPRRWCALGRAARERVGTSATRRAAMLISTLQKVRRNHRPDIPFCYPNRRPIVTWRHTSSHAARIPCPLSPSPPPTPSPRPPVSAQSPGCEPPEPSGDAPRPRPAPARDRSPEEECRNDAVPLVTPIEEGPTNRAPTEADRIHPEFRSNPRCHTRPDPPSAAP